MNGRERRKSERFSSRIFIQFENPLMKEVIGRGVVVDVSKSGFAADTETNLLLEHEYKCHLEIPLSVTAKVVRQVKPGEMKRYGFRLISVGFWDRIILRKILRGYLKTRKV